jgi:hypothetical protein
MTRRTILIELALVALIVGSLLMMPDGSRHKRALEYERFASMYHAIRLGAPVSDLDAVIEFPPGVSVWRTGDKISTIDEQFLYHKVGFSNHYIGEYHEILIYYDTHTNTIYGKRFVSVRRQNEFLVFLRNLPP